MVSIELFVIALSIVVIVLAWLAYGMMRSLSGRLDALSEMCRSNEAIADSALKLAVMALREEDDSDEKL